MADQPSVPRDRARRASAAAASVALALGLVGLVASPAAAVTSTVSTAVQLGDAFGDATVDEIVLAANISVSSPSIATGHTVTLDLAGHALTVYNLTVTPGTHLTVVDSSTGGSLTAYPLSVASNRAGITTTGATLEVRGGTVSGRGWGTAAGIGGDSTGYAAGTFLMSGGTVSATGGAYSAGLGGASPSISGPGGSGGTVQISGGALTAQGGAYTAGIGGGTGAAAGHVTISGGTVTATGGDNGPGIGNGYGKASGVDGSTALVEITGGAVTAAGGRYGAAPGIGGGYAAAGVKLDIAADAVVHVSDQGGYQPLGYGYGAPSSWWGEYTIAGTLVLDNDFQIPAGASITIASGGLLAGPGVIRQNFPGAWGGTVVNNGSMTAAIDSWTHLTGNDFSITFDSNRAGAQPTTAPTVRVFAPTLADGARTLPAFPTAAGALAWGWNTQPDGSGTAFDATTPLTASITVYADWRPFSSLTVTADDTTITAGGTVHLGVVGHDPISGLESDQTAFASYASDVTSDGVTGNAITMTSAGVHTLTASVGGVVGHVQVTVSAGALAAVGVTPSATALTAGDALSLTVTGADAYGNPLGDLTSQASFAASGSQSGPVAAQLTPTAAGTLTIVATVDGISAETEVSVSPAALHRIEIDLPLSWTAGQAVTVVATGYDRYDNPRGPLGTSELSASSSDAGDDVDGLTLTGYTAGTRLVQLSSSTLHMNYDYTVHVVAGAVTRIAVFDHYTIAAGSTTQFRVDGFDAWDNPTGAVTEPLTLTTDSPGATPGTAERSMRFVRAGTPEVTATLDADEHIRTSFTVEVIADALATIEVTPDAGTIPAGDTVELGYQGFDAYGNPIALCGCGIVLSTDEGSDVIVGDAITMTRAGIRTVTVTSPATQHSAAVSGTADVEVTPADPVQISLRAPATSVDQGGSLTFAVSGVDEYDNPIAEVEGVTLSSDQPTDVVDGLTVRFPHASPHVITATLGALSSRVLVQVIPDPALAGTGASPWLGASALLAAGVVLLGALAIGLRRRGARRLDRPQEQD